MVKLQLGPIVTVSKSCSGCSAERSESYMVQGDSGQDVYCTHLSVGKKRVGDTCWKTPEWCPVEVSSQPQAQQAGGEVVGAGINDEYPTNRYLFKYMCQRMGIELGVDRIADALKKVSAALATKERS